MTGLRAQDEGHPAVASGRKRYADLARTNFALREEVRQLREENTALARRLQRSAAGTQNDREIQRATLNLMQDAVESQKLAQREIVERRRAEEELREADRRKDTFLATLAHELRNPLASIRSGLRVARMVNERRGGSDHVFEVMERQVDHIVRLVDDLMEVSRITRGRIELKKELVELSSLIQRVVETSASFIDSAGHRLVANVPSETVMLDVDAVRIVQVLANLLINAAKFTDHGGTIWLDAECSQSEVVIRVRDTGIGIPVAALPRIFDLFVQVERGDGPATGGLGLGLTLARSIVQLHGGTIEARSEGPGHGSEFLVRLRRADAMPDVERLPRRTDRPAALASSVNILVVDDDYDVADAMTMFLEVLGTEVHAVHNGESALKAIQTYKPAVVLIDIGMPGMDGYEVARRARALPEGRAAALIALTGWGQDEDRRKSTEAGFDRHIVKGVDVDTLTSVVADLLKSRC